MYNVLIVEDQRSSQEFMKSAINRSNDKFSVSCVETDADNAMLHFAKYKIDLVLLDIHTNNKENGLKAAKVIKETYPHVKIVVLTFLIQSKYIEIARELGCEGFFYKDYSEGDLLELIKKVMNGEICYPDTYPTVNIGLAKTTDFTKRELDVLQAKVNGLSNVAVCELLGIKERTLNTHISHLKEKTGYDNLIKLVADVVSKKFVIVENE